MSPQWRSRPGYLRQPGSIDIQSDPLEKLEYPFITFSLWATWRMLIHKFGDRFVTQFVIQKGVSREKTDFSFVRDLDAFGRNGMGTSIRAERGGRHHGTLASQHA